MALSTNLISGLVSGFDWRSMIDQLMSIEHRPVDIVAGHKKDTEAKLAEWQSFNTKLLALKTASANLKVPQNFQLFNAAMTTDSAEVSAADLLSVSLSSTASEGQYSIQVLRRASAQKLSSASFASASESMGSLFTGDILINGRVVTISATDELADVRTKINNLNSGSSATHVTASIVRYGSSDYRLILTSDTTGSAGISLLNASSADVLENFGFTENTQDFYEIKNSITGGGMSDLFADTTSSVGNLLGLTEGEASTTLVIRDRNGTASDNISINLATDSLTAIRDAINTGKGSAGISASVISDTTNGTTHYRLKIDGIAAADPFSDQSHVFEAIGLIQGKTGDIKGVTGTLKMTTDGQVITSDTLLSDIDGYGTRADGDKIDFTGTDTANNPVNSSFLVTAESTVGDFLAAIENTYGNVQAAINGDGKIQITDEESSGASHLNVVLTDTIADGTLDFGTFGSAVTLRKRELIAGEDALLSVDGVEISRTTNSIDDVLTGITLNLNKADTDATATITIKRDISSITEKIKTLVARYNDVASYIATQQSYDTEKKKTGGILFGDGTLASVQTDIMSVFIQRVWGTSTDFSTLGLIGINLDNGGQLSVEEGTLKGYLQSNFNDIMNLFAANGTTSSGTLQYVAHSLQTKPGEYAVHITKAATQSSATSNTAVGGTLESGEELTITEGNKKAFVTLTSGMTVTDIVNAVNAEVEKVYTTTLAGAEELFGDAGKAAHINASTKWNSIFDGEGAAANLANGDVISFSGTRRNGSTVEGSYTIDDVATGTVQGLLTAIGEAFDGSARASISSSGQIILADMTSGSSQLSLTLDCGNAHNLNFGAVLADNPGGQEGRYSMDIDASADDTNHLVLAHKSHGSGFGFSIAESADLLWTGGDQTVNNGLDVAGTINGEEATGKGQTLAGNKGTANIDGLTIKYTGAAEGIEAGTVKMTFGVAEMFDRTLFHITDPLEGYVAYKEESLQGAADSYQIKIDEMEKRLAQKQETMVNRFVAMETALSRIKNQSTWLTAQLDAMSNG